jgi:hypothetical protein
LLFVVGWLLLSSYFFFAFLLSFFLSGVSSSSSSFFFSSRERERVSNLLAQNSLLQQTLEGYKNRVTRLTNRIEEL